MSYQNSEKGGDGLKLEELKSYHRGHDGTRNRKLGTIQKSLGETKPVETEIKRQPKSSNGR